MGKVDNAKTMNHAKLYESYFSDTSYQKFGFKQSGKNIPERSLGITKKKKKSV